VLWKTVYSRAMSASSFQASSAPPSSCPFHVGTLEDESSFISVKDLFKKPIDELVTDDIGRWRNSVSEIQQCFGDIHNMIRAHYTLSQQKSAMSIYPLIVASEEGNPSDPFNYGRQGVGGIYTLYRSPNEVYKYKPVHAVYEILKVANHLILGVFIIIEPYLQLTTNNKGGKRVRFMATLKEYHKKLVAAYDTVQSLHDAHDIDQLFVNSETKRLTQSILKLSIDYCESLLLDETTQTSGNIDMGRFMEYSNAIKPLIQKGMQLATDEQAKGVIAMLLKWKSMMSESEWKRLYVVIPVVWVTAKNNPREQLFRLLMDKENQNTHIIIGENIKNEYEARVLCGRVVHDRMMARFIFGIGDVWSQRKCQGLGSQTDSLMDYTRTSIKKYVEEYRPSSKL